MTEKSSGDWQSTLPHAALTVQGYGVPPLIEEAKRKILGGNLLRLHGMEQPATAAS